MEQLPQMIEQEWGRRAVAAGVLMIGAAIILAWGLVGALLDRRSKRDERSGDPTDRARPRDR